LLPTYKPCGARIVKESPDTDNGSLDTILKPFISRSVDASFPFAMAIPSVVAPPPPPEEVCQDIVPSPLAATIWPALPVSLLIFNPLKELVIPSEFIVTIDPPGGRLFPEPVKDRTDIILINNY